MTSPDMIKLSTRTWDDSGHPAWEIRGPLGNVVYRSLGNHLYLDPAHGASDAAVDQLADEARMLAATGTEKQMFVFLAALYHLFPQPPDGVPAGTAGWHTLRGTALTDAMRAAKWYAWPDDTLGGWCIMPINVPPSVGVPAVGAFLGEAMARHVAELHNAGLPTLTADPTFVTEPRR